MYVAHTAIHDSCVLFRQPFISITFNQTINYQTRSYSNSHSHSAPALSAGARAYLGILYTSRTSPRAPALCSRLSPPASPRRRARRTCGGRRAGRVRAPPSHATRHAASSQGLPRRSKTGACITTATRLRRRAGARRTLCAALGAGAGATLAGTGAHWRALGAHVASIVSNIQTHTEISSASNSAGWAKCRARLARGSSYPKRSAPQLCELLVVRLEELLQLPK